MTKFERKKILCGVLENVHEAVEEVRKYNYSPYDYERHEYLLDAELTEQQEYAHRVLDKVNAYLEAMLDKEV